MMPAVFVNLAIMRVVLLRTGIVLGRASAGNWVSTQAMLADLVTSGWPVLPLLLIAITVERSLRPRESNPRPSMLAAGVLPACAYLTLSVLHVAILPGWRRDG